MSCLREAQLHDVHAGKDERVSKLLANFADDLVPLAACERFFFQKCFVLLVLSSL